jgi:hypothetical protein
MCQGKSLQFAAIGCIVNRLRVTLRPPQTSGQLRKGPHAESLPDHGCSVTGPDLSPIPDAAWFTAGPRPADQAPPAGLPEPAIDAGWAGRAILAHLAGHAARQPRAIAIADGAHSLDFAAL